MATAKNACSCAACVALCAKGNPGWFAPKDVDAAAALMGMTRQAFIDKYCVVDYWVGDHGNTYVLAPAKLDPATRAPIEPTGVIVSYSYAFAKGRCALLADDGRCMVHAAKPTECASVNAADCATAPKAGYHEDVREKIVGAWRAAGVRLRTAP